MAGAMIASAVVKEVVSKLDSALWVELSLQWNFKEDLESMKSTLSTILAVLDDAEERSIKERALCLWLKMLKNAAYDIDDLLNDFLIEAQKGDMRRKLRQFFSPSNPLVMPHKLKKMRKRLDGVAAQRSKFHLKESTISDMQEVIRRRETVSAVDECMVYGRDEEKEMLINLLLNTDCGDDVSVIPIVGIGGLGKTTLAKLAFNDERVEGSGFDLRLWVYVSVEFDFRRLLGAIASTAGETCDLRNLESARNFVVKILAGKKYLIVLDDIWNEDAEEWENLKHLLRSGSRGSKIIVTTRSLKVASLVGTTPPHCLKVLSEDDCWALFKRRAFESNGEENNPDPELLQIGREIVRKCGGVPLAASSLGSTLRHKRTREAWSAVKDSEIWESEQVEQKLMSSLRLSYHQMPPRLKQCFAYCAIFPKGYDIDKDKLIHQWIAQGFIQYTDGPLPVDVGEEYINSLRWMSFLQDFKELREKNGRVSCKMHDLVHDLAQFVAGDEVLIIADAQKSRPYDKGCRYVSLIGYEEPSKIPTASLQKVRSLHFRTCALKEPPSHVFSWTSCLRTLDLSGCWMDNLPSSICKLRKLRYLDASNLPIQSLPKYISCLTNLLMLNISHSAVEKLPDSFGNLQRLTSLNLSGCTRLKTLPRSIGNLQNLLHLDLSECYELLALPETFGELHKLQHLSLSKHRYLKKLPRPVTKLLNLRTLDLGQCEQVYELPESLANMTSLRDLLIDECQSLIGMPQGIAQLVNLQRLPLFVVGKQDSNRYGSIAELEHINFVGGELKIKHLENLNSLRDAKRANLKEKKNLKSLALVWSLWPPSADGDEEVLEGLLPHRNLAALKITGYRGARFPGWMMNKIESWLPNLVKITLSHMRGCDHLPPLGQLPYLRELEIVRCGAKSIGIEFYGGSHTATAFRSLEKLRFVDMGCLSEWLTAAVVDDGQGEQQQKFLFPFLAKLEIDNCHILKPYPSLPTSVTDLMVRRCSEDTITLGGSPEQSSSSSSSALKKLYIEGYSDVVTPRIDNCMEASFDGWEGLQFQTALETLCISSCEKLIILPESMRHLTSLRTLEIRSCRNLAALPEWIGELTSLQSLIIWHCPKLVSLPQGLQRLTALKTFRIEVCSRILKQRCKEGTGQDWAKIAHVPYVNIST